jgi:hypothetical protein
VDGQLLPEPSAGRDRAPVRQLPDGSRSPRQTRSSVMLCPQLQTASRRAGIRLRRAVEAMNVKPQATSDPAAAGRALPRQVPITQCR